MGYNENTKPGMGDPYWYEWSVGLQYIIKMLNPESEIEYVELQANVPLGLDDIVVTYNDGKKRFIQVKHTRNDDSLTFGDLVSKDSSSGRSLLQELAIGWNEEKGKYAHSDVLLFTNRTAGQRVSTTKTKPPFKRPALASFLSKLKEQLNSAELFEEINFPNCKEAWEEWKQQLDCIPDDSDKLTFLKCLQIDTNNSGLSQIYEDLRRDIKVLFQTDDAIAEEILKSLDHALREWSTSGRNASRIDKEEVYNRLSVKQEFLSYNQDLIPNDPFFPSREKLVELLENELRSNQHKVVFVSGIPGIGKTNIISKLNVKRESLIDIRYYAYEPIDPAKEYFTGDVSRRVDKNNFWNELFNQLRKLLKGQLYKYGVPVINDLMNLEQKRCTFFRIASEYASARGRSFIVAIDGIDHAARAANIENTFLSTLPNPEFIPSNVKIVIAGQPKSAYRNYPDWLFQNTSDVFEIDVPPLQTEDIQSLVDARFPDESSDYRMQLTGLISKYAEGNTLAAIFAVYEAVQEPILFKLEERLKKRKLSGNIQEYYKTIWKSAIGRIQSLFVDYKVAGVFAFLNEPVNERKLSSIYSNERLSITDWRNVLKELRPLLSEKSGNYTILHNDVRVFLSSIIGQDQDHVQEVYSNLTDYYLTLTEKNEAFYHDIFRFMKAAKRLNEFEKVFSPEFIIEAYVNGVELDEIHVITTDILKGTIANVPINWTQIRSLAFGYMTIDQIEKSQYEIDSVDFRKLISDADSFIKQPDIVKNNTIKEILKIGISDDELVIAGSIIDYTYNTEIFGYQLSYLCDPWMLPSDESYKFERNSRLFLQQRTDFTEDRHHSITLHHNGVESFKDSNICCGFSKAALNLFGWKVHLSKDGVVLLDSSGVEIGRFECYYAFRDLSSRYPSNQPILQRWVIKQTELEKHLTQLKPLSFKTVVDIAFTQFE